MNTHTHTSAALLLLTLAFTAAAPLYGQKVGTSSLQFLKVTPTARASAMGDAYSTLAAGSDAVFWNPAGLAVGEQIEVTGTHILWLFDTRQSTLAGSFPLADLGGTVGLHLQYVDYGSIDVTRTDQLAFVGSGPDIHYNPGLTGETFSPSSYVLGISYAQRMTDRFTAGITAKYIRESLWNSATIVLINPTTGAKEEVNTFASLFLFDFGMQYNTGYRSVRIGVSIQNFGEQVKFAKEAFPAPLMFRIGTAADLIGPDALLGASESNRITFAYDLFQPNDYAQQMHLGTEYAFDEAFFVRAGYKVYYDNDSFTAGAGIRQTFTGFPLSIDYSYGAMGDYLPSVHRLSVGVQFK
ncbi:MAG: PorV/PorQ family protein [Bacteroidetes bacterium]|nr:PorV/PorQ family protein [Bacteroidota bacterium]